MNYYITNLCHANPYILSKNLMNLNVGKVILLHSDDDAAVAKTLATHVNALYGVNIQPICVSKTNAASVYQVLAANTVDVKSTDHVYFNLVYGTMAMRSGVKGFAAKMMARGISCTVIGGDGVEQFVADYGQSQSPIYQFEIPRPQVGKVVQIQLRFI